MKKLLLIALVAFGLAGCTTAPFQPSQGIMFTEYKAPLQLEYNNNTDLGRKVGTGSATSILGLVAFGDCSVQAAAKDGGIKTIKHTDYEYTNVLFGFFTKTTVYVYGD
ncbi:MAG: TRL-like family protein [Alphaproteobacteria bacterium]|nr:TRL-like family protein [Alphaproteobacteria bacterium]